MSADPNLDMTKIQFSPAAKLLTVTRGGRLEKKNESGSVENEGEQEIRTRAAEQAEKWLVNLRGDLEEKKREREERKEYKRRGLENRQRLDVVRDTDFKNEGRVNAGRMMQMNVGQG